MEREKAIEGALALLRSHGFSCESFGGNTCFDIIARNGETTIVVKVYDNIDSIRKDQGEELKKIGRVLCASCVIIGERTKVFGLQEDAVYLRYGVPTVAMETFARILSNELPSVICFKGRQMVGLEAGELHRKRLALGISHEELAKRIGVAPETIHRFEKGAGTSLETAQLLEKELNDPLISKAKVFEKQDKTGFDDEEPKDKLLGKIHGLGVKMSLFSHSPFRAYGNAEKGIFIGTGKGSADIPKKAIELSKTKAIIGNDSMIITKEYKRKSVQGIPVIEEEELDSISKPKELRSLIKEHERQK